MAALNIAISNSLNVFGPAPSNKWNAHLWNAFFWGEGDTGLVKVPGKVLGESISFGDSLSLYTFFTLILQNDIAPESDMGSEHLYDASGYSRIFPGNTTDGEDRVSSSWTDGSASASTWTSGVASSTSWSAL